MTTNHTLAERGEREITMAELDGMIEVYAECHAFVTEQSEGEWTDELVANDARKLSLLVTRHRIAARKAALDEAARAAESLRVLDHEGYDLAGFAGPNGYLVAAANKIRTLSTQPHTNGDKA